MQHPHGSFLLLLCRSTSGHHVCDAHKILNDGRMNVLVESLLGLQLLQHQRDALQHEIHAVGGHTHDQVGGRLQASALHTRREELEEGEQRGETTGFEK